MDTVAEMEDVKWCGENLQNVRKIKNDYMGKSLEI